MRPYSNASHTESYDIPDDADISVNFGWATQDDYDDSISVSEEIPLKDDIKDQEEYLATSNTQSVIRCRYDNDGVAIPLSEHVTLTLDVKNIEVKSIQGVIYDTSSRSVTRSRLEKTKDTPF